MFNYPLNTGNVAAIEFVMSLRTVPVSIAQLHIANLHAAVLRTSDHVIGPTAALSGRFRGHADEVLVKVADGVVAATIEWRFCAACTTTRVWVHYNNSADIFVSFCGGILFIYKAVC